MCHILLIPISVQPRNKAQAQALLKWGKTVGVGSGHFLMAYRANEFKAGVVTDYSGQDVTSIFDGLWRPNEPDNYQGKERCVVPYGKYGDANCDDYNNPFACQM